MVKIKAIVFDANGVIYTRDEDKYRHVAKVLKQKKAGKTLKDFKAARKKRKRKAHRGEMSSLKLIKATLADLGIRLGAKLAETLHADILASALNDAEDITGGALPKLKKYDLYIFSDSVWSSEVKKKLLKNLKLFKYFKGIFCSCELGKTKHVKESFDILLEKINRAAATVLFVGHQPHEIRSANQAGITTVSLGTDVGADYKIESLGELVGLVKNINS